MRRCSAASRGSPFWVGSLDAIFSVADDPVVWIAIGSISGFLGVALGAFGAHGLAETLSPQMMDVYKTGVHYHLIHAVALLAVGFLSAVRGSKAAAVAGWMFTVGILLFSGSLYALAISEVRILGLITPFGGVAFLVGWGALAIAGWGQRRTAPASPV